MSALAGIALSFAIAACGSPSPPAYPTGAAWTAVTRELHETLPPESTLLVRRDAGFAELARAFGSHTPEPVIDPRGFCYAGDCEDHDDFAGYRWVLLTTDRPMGDEPIRERGRFGLVTPLDDSATRARFDAAYAAVHRRDFIDAGAALTIYFSGNPALLRPLDESNAPPLAEKTGTRLDVAAGTDALLERLRLSRAHLVGNIDTAHQGIPYFHTRLMTPEVEREHANWDGIDLASRYALALRIVGDTLGGATEPGEGAALQSLRTSLTRALAADGLAYRRDDTFSDVEADVFDQGSWLLWRVDEGRRDRSERDRAAIEAMIVGLLRKATPTSAGLRFAHPTFLPDGTRGIGRDNWPEADPCHHGGRLLFPLALYLRDHPGSENARRLFDGISAYIVGESGVFDDEGGFVGHTHSRTNTLLGLLIRAVDTGDESRVAWVRRAVDRLIASTPRWGWFPEFLAPPGDPDPRTGRAEADALADMIEILLILADRDDAYWDVIDRYVRNGLLEAQWSAPPPDPSQAAASLPGAFCGFCTPNAWGDATMNCCAPAGALALAALRSRAVQRDRDRVSVNLAIPRVDDDLVLTENRTGDFAQMTATLKKPMRLEWRAPDFVGEDWNATPAARRVGSRLEFGNLPAGTVVTVNWRLPERTETAVVLQREYRYSWRGNDVVRVEPEAQKSPLFDRPSHRSPR